MDSRYQQLMAKRGYLKSAAPDEQFWRCLCCRDSGVIPVDVVGRYLKTYEPDIWDETQFLGCAAAAVECSHRKCSAGMISVPSPDNPEVSTMQPRFSYGLHHIRPDICAWIHEQEFQRLQQEQPAPLRTAIAQSISTIGNTMPAAVVSNPLEHAEPVAEPDEVAGLHRGDRVIVADRSSDRNGQGGIIRGFDWSQSQGQYVAFVEFDDCSVDTFSPVILEQIQEAA